VGPVSPARHDSAASGDAPASPPLVAAVITCSDSAAAGTAADLSGPLAVRLLEGLGHRVPGPVAVVPDDPGAIGGAVRAALADGAVIVVTTGGTGAGPRDVTPEALRSIGLRELPGLGEAIRAAARGSVPTADLSRALGGVLAGAVVVALPGSTGGVRDGLAAVGGLLGHAVAVAGGQGHADRGRSAPGQDPAHVESPPPGGEPGADPPEPATADPYALVGPQPLTEAGVQADVASSRAGAVVTFAGVVRDHDHGRVVTDLHYEAHPDASRVLAEVLAEARTRPGVIAAAARHRVGDLVVGDIAFVAAVSAAHRGEAFAACSWLVDEVKARLPVWKHQRFADGSDEWVNCA
jgi:molybdenum cofactor synthesis domain-containing protein